MTVREALAEAGMTIARRDAETLLAHVLLCERSWLLGHAEAVLEAAPLLRFRELAGRRAAGEPLQYLLGVQEFFGLLLHVTPDTLIPRPETEHLVEAVLAWAAARAVQGPLHVIDVGTGTGAIALALRVHLPAAEVTACDLSEAALAVARQNALLLGLASRVTFVHSDLLDSTEGSIGFDVVVSNPPYVPSGDAATMQTEVVDYEPHTALFAGEDGLAVYRRLIPQAHAALRPGGLLAMEIGYGQRAALASLLAGWSAVRFIDDYAGIPRVVLAERA